MRIPKNIRLNVIIVDDSEDDRFFIKTALSVYPNITIHDFDNGRETVDYLLQRQAYRNNKDVLPDIVIMDINMPGMSGFDVFEELEKHAVFDSVRFIILSSSLMESDLEKCAKFKMNSYQKPFTIDKFQAVLEEIIGNEHFEFDHEGRRTNFDEKRPPENNNY